VTILATFNGQNGASPNAVVQGTDGNFYGAAFSGGAFGHGDVFRATPTGEITAIYSFSCTVDSCYVNDPFSMILGSDGSLYGVSLYGGKGSGQGSIFRVTLDGEFSGVYAFSYNIGDNPNSIAQSSDGNLFGTAANGGEFGHGTFFRISTSGELKGLHAFCSQPNCADGAFPLSAIQGRDGNFYGTTVQGGAHGAGAIYELTAAGNYRVLYSFCSLRYCDDGGDPLSIVQDNDGNFFGAAYADGGFQKFGTVFEFTAAHQFKVLHSFNPLVDGGDPSAGVTLGNDGNFYGVCENGNPDTRHLRGPSTCRMRTTRRTGTSTARSLRAWPPGPSDCRSVRRTAAGCQPRADLLRTRSRGTITSGPSRRVARAISCPRDAMLALVDRARRPPLDRTVGHKTTLL